MIQTDHLNTPRLVADASQTTVWRWDQAEPFAATTPNEDPDGNTVAFDLPLRLPGQYYDKETNLSHNYFRDYDPSIGRYAQSDPLGLIAGIDTYGYVKGMPLNFSDPLGLINLLVGTGGSYVFGGGVEGSGGVYVNPGLGGSAADAGVFASGGYGGGLNISGDVYVGAIFGGSENVPGPTTNTNLGLGPISVTIFYAPDGSGPIGGTIGIGPSLPVPQASGTNSNTVSWSISKWISSFSKRKGPRQPQACKP